MMDDANISSATSTSQISSLLLGQRLSSAAASISSSSSHASSFRGVPDDHWARQMVFSPFAGLRQPAASHLRPSPGGAAGTAAEGGGDVGTAVASLGFDPAALLQGGAEMCPAADFDPYDGESEEGAEASEEQRRPPPRSGSKRSRAAEVHNLSEKRRRSRINEKMKALQNLIPNSNKTDKASMLDEAIEYLKQLQLQVQMLSMRNGLSLQPMYLPGTLPALQSSHVRMGLNPGDGSLMSMGVGMVPASQDASVHHSSLEMAKRGASSHQHMMPSVAALPDPGTATSLGIESSQFHPFPFSVPEEEIFEQGRLDAGHGDGSMPGGIAGASGQAPGGGMHAGKPWKP